MNTEEVHLPSSVLQKSHFRIMRGFAAVTMIAIALSSCGEKLPADGAVSTTPTKFAMTPLVPTDYSAVKCASPATPDHTITERHTLQRIIITDAALLDTVCALGIADSVVGVIGTPAKYLGPAIAALPSIDESRIDENPEVLTQLKPTLILGTKITPLSAAAKAKNIQTQVLSLTTNWKELVSATGTALGYRTAIRKRLTDYTEFSAKLGIRSAAGQTQLSIIRFSENQTWVIGAEAFAAQVLTQDFGAMRPVAQQNWSATPTVGNSAEGDKLFAGIASEADTDYANSVLRSTNWRDLGVSAWNATYLVDDELWFRSRGIIAAQTIIKNVRNKLQ